LAITLTSDITGKPGHSRQTSEVAGPGGRATSATRPPEAVYRLAP